MPASSYIAYPQFRKRGQTPLTAGGPVETGRAGVREEGSAAEVGGVGGAVAAGRDAVGDADADHAEAAREDVGPMTRAMHPGGDHRARRGERAASPADVLADGVRAARAGPAGAPDAGGERRPVARGVVEEVLGDHGVSVARGGAAKL